MRSVYITLKYAFLCIWSMFVIAPFLWALSTSFKDFQSVTSGATYIPWLQFDPTLEGWKVLLRSPARGGVDIVVNNTGIVGAGRMEDRGCRRTVEPGSMKGPMRSSVSSSADVNS